MFFQTILVSLIAILLGLALTLSGYRFFVFLLPIWGFFAGFSATASAIAAGQAPRRRTAPAAAH